MTANGVQAREIYANDVIQQRVEGRTARAMGARRAPRVIRFFWETFMNRRRTLALVAAAGLATAGGLALRSSRSHAADHLDPPARTDPASVMTGTTADRNADIADVYAWHQGTSPNQTLVLALSYAGPNAPAAGQAVPCDRDVLYSIHIDNSGDTLPDQTITARFATDSTNRNCFVRFEGLPGVTGARIQPVELTRTYGMARAFVGLRDDAFFFDLQGFRETLAMAGTAPAGMGVRMTSDRDFFAGRNTPVIVVEVPVSAVVATGRTALKVWATTSRIAP